MQRTPNAPHVGIPTDHLPGPDLLDFLARIAHQVLGHAADLLLLEVPHAHALLTPVNVVRPQHGVFGRPWRDAELGLGIQCRESLQERRRQERFEPPRRAPVVAVVKVQSPTLQDEGADAVLFGETVLELGRKGRVGGLGGGWKNTYPCRGDGLEPERWHSGEHTRLGWREGCGVVPVVVGNGDGDGQRTQAKR